MNINQFDTTDWALKGSAGDYQVFWIAKNNYFVVYKPTGAIMAQAHQFSTAFHMAVKRNDLDKMEAA
jgi:hypothetical protein